VVYLGDDPLEYIGHFGGGGLACKISSKNIILDLTPSFHVAKCLRDANIIVPDRLDPIYRANHAYNLYVNPALFEEVAL